jgi:hypothetical protein
VILVWCLSTVDEESLVSLRGSDDHMHTVPVSNRQEVPWIELSRRCWNVSEHLRIYEKMGFKNLGHWRWCFKRGLNHGIPFHLNGGSVTRSKSNHSWSRVILEKLTNSPPAGQHVPVCFYHTKVRCRLVLSKMNPVHSSVRCFLISTYSKISYLAPCRLLLQFNFYRMHPVVYLFGRLGSVNTTK